MKRMESLKRKRRNELIRDLLTHKISPADLMEMTNHSKDLLLSEFFEKGISPSRLVNMVIEAEFEDKK